ncbi:MAG: hypothetical protein IKR41_11795 [Bacteroidales bacterium]|nr:hypothetical protein [Bacteroidales bacterium]
MYKYRLGTYKEVGKTVCPYCGKKEFVRLIINESGKIPGEKYGRCDRDTCPSRAMSQNGIIYPEKDLDTLNLEAVKNNDKPKEYYDDETVDKYAEKRTENALCRYLLQQVKDKDRFENVLKMYRIGSINDGIIFWQIDQLDLIHRGKVMFYESDGHRKKAAGAITMMWKILNRDRDSEPEMCFFGQHLVYKSDKPVGIVESEKTALVASYAMPELTWIATLSVNNFNSERMNFFKSFKKPVFVFPDFDGYGNWAGKTEFIRSALNIDITVDNTIKKLGSGKQDLADLFLS